jgi:hypothetical protein
MLKESEPVYNITKPMTIYQSPLDVLEPSPTVSGRYAFVSTSEVVRELSERHNMRVTRVLGSAVNPYGTHIVRMRASNAPDMKVGDSLPEIVIRNSFDASSSFLATLGLFRLACSNGMMVHTGSVLETRLPHVGSAREKADAAIGIMLSGYQDLNDRVLRMQSRVMLASEQAEFGLRALELRGGAGDDPHTVLQGRRAEDNGNDLWRVFNRIQENVIRGGGIYRSTDGRYLRVKAVGSATRDFQLNTGLWSIAESYLN